MSEYEQNSERTLDLVVQRNNPLHDIWEKLSGDRAPDPCRDVEKLNSIINNMLVEREAQFEKTIEEYLSIAYHMGSKVRTDEFVENPLKAIEFFDKLWNIAPKKKLRELCAEYSDPALME